MVRDVGNDRSPIMRLYGIPRGRAIDLNGIDESRAQREMSYIPRVIPFYTASCHNVRRADVDLCPIA